MENDFEHIESEYESFKSSFEGYIFDILYNISNFSMNMKHLLWKLVVCVVIMYFQLKRVKQNIKA